MTRKKFRCIFAQNIILKYTMRRKYKYGNRIFIYLPFSFLCKEQKKQKKYKNVLYSSATFDGCAVPT